MRRLRWTGIGAIVSLAIVVIVAAIAIGRYVAKPVSLPAPRQSQPAGSVSHADFVGADRCAGCHVAEYAAWKGSTHGRAGGVPAPDLVLAPFNGKGIQFADARVVPRVHGGVYEFVVQQRDEPARTLRVDGVIGGGHIYGGGTQGFVTNFDDGTLRLLPFEWSRQTASWFCNTNSRSGRGWSPITSTMRLVECGDWPPTRVLGDNPRYANCQ